MYRPGAIIIVSSYITISHISSRIVIEGTTGDAEGGVTVGCHIKCTVDCTTFNVDAVVFLFIYISRAKILGMYRIMPSCNSTAFFYSYGTAGSMREETIISRICSTVKRYMATIRTYNSSRNCFITNALIRLVEGTISHHCRCTRRTVVVSISNINTSTLIRIYYNIGECCRTRAHLNISAPLATVRGCVVCKSQCTVTADKPYRTPHMLIQNYASTLKSKVYAFSFNVEQSVFAISEIIIRG